MSCELSRREGAFSKCLEGELVWHKSLGPRSDGRTVEVGKYVFFCGLVQISFLPRKTPQRKYNMFQPAITKAISSVLLLFQNKLA